MLSKVILAAIAILVIAFLYLKLTAVRIPGTQARSLVAGGALLVDVRTAGEYEDGGLQGSINIPIQELSGRMEELGAKDGEVVVYCASGARSAMAKRLLERSGFTKVHDLGGMARW